MFHANCINMMDSFDTNSIYRFVDAELCRISGRQTDHLTIMSDPENSSVAVASAAADKTNVAATDNNEETATKTGT